MSRRSLAVFSAGFVCGLVFLGVIVRETGLRTIKASAAPLNPAAAAPGVPALSLMGRRLMERQLIIPVAGVHAAALQDHFNDARGGHRHEAIDIMAPRGTPVLAADEGAVAKLFLSKPGGLTVYQFDPSRTFCYYYAHLDSYAAGLKEGALLRKGDVLGFVGSTGNASPDGPHLHFAIFQLGPETRWWQGTPIDPYEFLAHAR